MLVSKVSGCQSSCSICILSINQNDGKGSSFSNTNPIQTKCVKHKFCPSSFLIKWLLHFNLTHNYTTASLTMLNLLVQTVYYVTRHTHTDDACDLHTEKYKCCQWSKGKAEITTKTHAYCTCKTLTLCVVPSAENYSRTCLFYKFKHNKSFTITCI